MTKVERFRWLRAIIWASSLAAVSANAATPAGSCASRMARSAGDPSNLIVAGSPFIVLGGELHNSSASSVADIENVFARFGPTAVNTLLVPVTWQQFEPREGTFDFTLVDALINQARINKKRVVLLWFGSWKNSTSSYAPTWVLEDTHRFPRVVTKDGGHLETLSLFGAEQTFAAEKRAYTALLQRIRSVDQDGRIVMMQVENEVGILGQNYDYSPQSLKFLNEPVPEALMAHMRRRDQQLRPELRQAWLKAGKRSEGNWTTVFGDTAEAREFALAWSYASYIGALAQAGTQQCNLPAYVNAWIVQSPAEAPGGYPAGGPVSRVMDIYKAAAPNLVLSAPDIYLPDFRGITADYTRDDNPLFVPESAPETGRGFLTLGQQPAIGFAVFGADDQPTLIALDTEFRVLTQLSPLLLTARARGYATYGVFKQKGETGTSITSGNIDIQVRYVNPNAAAYGTIVRDAADHFYIAGDNMVVTFSSRVAGKVSRIAVVHEGKFIGGQWQPGRLLNGDETFHNEGVRVDGMDISYTVAAEPTAPTAPQPTLDTIVGQGRPLDGVRSVRSPNIYGVRLYWRDR